MSERKICWQRVWKRLRRAKKVLLIPCDVEKITEHQKILDCVEAIEWYDSVVLKSWHEKSNLIVEEVERNPCSEFSSDLVEFSILLFDLSTVEERTRGLTFKTMNLICKILTKWLDLEFSMSFYFHYRFFQSNLVRTIYRFRRVEYFLGNHSSYVESIYLGFAI